MSVVPFIHSLQRLPHVSVLYYIILLLVHVQFVDHERHVRVQRGIVEDGTDL